MIRKEKITFTKGSDSLRTVLTPLSGRVVAIFLACLLTCASAAEREKPVARLAARVYTLHTSNGDASIPIEISLDLATAHPEITRAAIVFHGKGRNVEGYFLALERAANEAGHEREHTVLLAPQFLREEDVQAHHLPKNFLRWRAGSWTAGQPAIGPETLSTFDLIDAILRDLGDRAKLPNLQSVVLIGHSGGGQLLNRYAVVGIQPAALVTTGIRVRFIIANPSSYLYFNDDRPQADGSFAPFQGVSCPEFNHWRYGPTHAPVYIGDTSAEMWRKREFEYVRADVIYLLGADDTDPAQVDLDVSCAGEAQGPERLDRGRAYFRYLKARHPHEFRHQLWFVPGVGHYGSDMVESQCAIAAIFDVGRCETDGSGTKN
jgi:pimeloyl-ACP methyl ester carboxylesterase